MNRALLIEEVTRALASVGEPERDAALERPRRDAGTNEAGLESELRETKRWAARLEAELTAHHRERDAERAGCAQVLRDLTSELRKLRERLAQATADSAELGSSCALLASHLETERRERRRAVQFIADQDLLDAYATAEHPPDVELLATTPARGRREP